MTQPRVLRSEEFRCTQVDSFDLGPISIPFADGDRVDMVGCVPASRSAINLKINAEHSLGLIALCVDMPGLPVGLYMPLDAATLRQVGASLISMANTIDEGKGRQ